MSHYPSKHDEREGLEQGLGQGSGQGLGQDLLAGPQAAFSWLPGGKPAVHRGFLNSWRANGLNQRVIQRICEILEEGDVDQSEVKVLCTGEGPAASLLCHSHTAALTVPHRLTELCQLVLPC